MPSNLRRKRVGLGLVVEVSGYMLVGMSLLQEGSSVEIKSSAVSMRSSYCCTSSVASSMSFGKICASMYISAVAFILKGPARTIPRLGHFPSTLLPMSTVCAFKD